MQWLKSPRWSCVSSSASFRCSGYHAGRQLDTNTDEVKSKGRDAMFCSQRCTHTGTHVPKCHCDCKVVFSRSFKVEFYIFLISCVLEWSLWRKKYIILLLEKYSLPFQIPVMSNFLIANLFDFQGNKYKQLSLSRCLATLYKTMYFCPFQSSLLGLLWMDQLPWNLDKILFFYIYIYI